MRLSILQKSNITIMAVAAVVIVVCLLGSWAYMDDEDDAGFRDPVIGDYDTFIMTVSYVDGQSVNHRYTSTLTAIWDDGTRSYYSLYDDGSSYAWDSEFSGNWADFSTLELIGEETVDSPVFGPVDCEVYLSEEYGQMYWFNPDYPNFVKIERTYDDGSVETTYLQDSTQFGDAPEFTALDTRGPVPGDYSIYEMYGSDGHIIGSYAYYVNSVEDGMVWYEIFDDGTGLTVSDVCPVEEYIWSPSEYGEHVAVTLVRSDMGTFLCDVYQYTAVDTVLIYMVDSTTGVLCMIENHASGETYSEVLTYSTHVSSEWAYEGLREADAGDYGAYSYITGNAEGVTGCGTVFMEVETVYDGTPSVTVVGDGISERMDWYPIFTMEKYEAVGTETVCTYYGDLVCDVVVTESADVTMTYLVHDGGAPSVPGRELHRRPRGRGQALVSHVRRQHLPLRRHHGDRLRRGRRLRTLPCGRGHDDRDRGSAAERRVDDRWLRVPRQRIPRDRQRVQVHGRLHRRVRGGQGHRLRGKRRRSLFRELHIVRRHEVHARLRRRLLGVLTKTYERGSVPRPLILTEAPVRRRTGPSPSSPGSCGCT